MTASIRQLHDTPTSAQALARHHTVQTFRPRMTVNRRFMADFMAADAPCFALGFVEEQKRVFEFYGHGVYHALVNPNNPVVRLVLACMVQMQDYVFFSIDARIHGAATYFRSPLEVAGFAANFPRIERSTTTQEQYARTVKSFSLKPEPPGVILHWVCRDNLDALDLDHNRLDMIPSR
ncbi:MAG TPA: hypothetical protein VN325_02510 [Steroidobacteraceae bacterium]|nr:hypothetical protein [Steroidobacteraceae bacterium]